MKNISLLFLLFTLIQPIHAQNFLGIFEVGDEIPFLTISSDAETGMPTDPVNLGFSILHEGTIIASGAMSNVMLGVNVGLYPTSGNAPGQYHILVTGLIGGVTNHTFQTYSLLPVGKGIASIASEVGGLNGLTPLTNSDYEPYHAEILTRVESATNEIFSNINSSCNLIAVKVDSTSQEMQIASREYSRSRLWYAQDAIDSATRKVPADLPSHLEVQLAAPGDILFASPVETFYRVYDYPNALNASKPSREIRSTTPPIDGVFYKIPDMSW
ncbi:MAG: hypothetical protein C4527_21350 [Candidatus Omnitrophota bacterium]|jgi:hypothetical protein|nr:MAG: hypothetical protein C4527_21350 [Candidatus Omnitrophota bacterium]